MANGRNIGPKSFNTRWESIVFLHISLRTHTNDQNYSVLLSLFWFWLSVNISLCNAVGNRTLKVWQFMTGMQMCSESTDVCNFIGKQCVHPMVSFCFVSFVFIFLTAYIWNGMMNCSRYSTRDVILYSVIWFYVHYVAQFLSIMGCCAAGSSLAQSHAQSPSICCFCYIVGYTYRILSCRSFISIA